MLRSEGFTASSVFFSGLLLFICAVSASVAAERLRFAGSELRLAPSVVPFRTLNVAMAALAASTYMFWLFALHPNVAKTPAGITLFD
jgi:hypothetical protein